MDLFKSLRRSVALPVAEKLKGWPLRQYLRELERSQWWSAAELQALQDQKLAALVEHSYRTVPYYRKRMDESGVRPEEIRSVRDLPRLPIVTKDDIRHNFPEHLVSSEFDPASLVLMSSSGSTGEPFAYYMSQQEKAAKWAGLFRFWTWAGYELGDRYAMVLAVPVRAFARGTLLHTLERRFSGVLTVPASELRQDTVEEYAQQILRFRPTMVRGYASSLYFLANHLKDRRLSMDLRSVCTTGETLFDHQRTVMEDVFGCRVQDGYGAEGMEIAAQCEHGSYHVNTESVIVEIVDEHGSPCPSGESGQVVLTDLNHRSMPFLRYNVQDVAVASRESCACGRHLPVLDRVVGRLTDVGVTPSGRAIVVHNFTGLFMNHSDAVTSFQVVQDRPESFRVFVVPGPRFEDARNTLEDKLQRILGDDVVVALKIVDDIPTTAGGKRRLFVSNCGLRAVGGRHGSHITD